MKYVRTDFDSPGTHDPPTSTEPTLEEVIFGRGRYLKEKLFATWKEARCRKGRWKPPTLRDCESSTLSAIQTRSACEDRDAEAEGVSDSGLNFEALRADVVFKSRSQFSHAAKVMIENPDLTIRIHANWVA